MLQSSPAYIKCYQCKRGPKEFSFLLCNHIICSKCISKNIQLRDKYNLVKCSCGCLTYFNEQNQMVSSYDNDDVSHRLDIMGMKIKQTRTRTMGQQYQQNLQINVNNKQKRNTTNNIIVNNKNKNYNNKNKTSRLIQTPNRQISEIFSLLQSQNNHTINSESNSNRSNSNTNRSNEQQYKQCYQQNNNDDQTTTGVIMMGNQNDKSYCEQSLLLENYCSIIRGKQKQSKIKSKQKQSKNKKNNTNNLINQFSTHYIIDNKSSNSCDNERNTNTQINSVKLKNEWQRQLKDNRQPKYVDSQQSLFKRNKNSSYQPINIPNVKNINSSVTLPQTIQSLASLNQQQQPSLKQKTNSNQHSRFHNQLSFIKLMFNKDLQQVQYIVNNLVNEMKSTYQKFQNIIRSLYVEQVIITQNKDQQFFQPNVSQLIKQKYQKDISQKFTLIKDSLSTIFHSFKHNQNKLISTPTLSSHHHHQLNIHQFLNDKNNKKTKYYSKKNHYETAQTLNNSQIIEDQQQGGLLNYYDCDQQSQTMKNLHVHKFQTVNEKMQRLTTKNNQGRNTRSPKNHLNSFNSSSNKRVQTQNVHTNVKRSRVNVNFYQKENQDRANCSIQHLTPTPEMNYRLTQKPQRRTNPSSLQKQTENKRRQIIYFSPPLPYCQKHLQKKQKQAKNYISYIEKLCHDKKMKNHQQLFKKVKQNNQLYEFRNRGE